MDREIAPGDRRRQLLRRWAIAVGLGVAVWGVVIGGLSLLRPSLKRTQVVMATVDAGPVDASLSATGVVVPEVEQVISSPIDARVLDILARAGTAVKAGDPVLRLDASASVLAVDTLDQDLALKVNEQTRAKLSLEHVLADLDSRVDIKTLELESARLQHARNTQLFGDNLLSIEALRQSDVHERQAAIELRQLEAARRNAQASTRAELEGLALELAKLRKARTEAARVLDLATARADRDGVVTWTLTEEGASVSKGAAVARLADLRSYRVDASVSDVFVGRLRTGLPAKVSIDGQTLEGMVTDVLPTVQNGVVTIRIALAARSHPLLRPNLRVEVFIVTGRRDRALRVRKGSSTGGEGYQYVFVVRGDHANRVRVRFGLSGFDVVEVQEGLAAGDTIIVSDMSDYQHLSSIRLR